ncbi:MAG: hypothetical protein HYX87_08240 [Chloroflexi bacterium]|nr:hypothetical protein [Chloroflexota bacterium]
MRLAAKASPNSVAEPAYRRVPNINLLANMSRRKALTQTGRYSLVLSLVGILALIFMLYRMNAAQADKAILSAQQATVRSQVDAAKAQKGEITALQTEIQRLQQGTKDFRALSPFASLSRLLSEVQRLASSTGVTLTSVKQKAGGAIIVGWSPSPAQALAFQKAISPLPGVAQCSMSSLSKSANEARYSFTLDLILKERDQQ